jgi:magnesium chelatase subunit I
MIYVVKYLKCAELNIDGLRGNIVTNRAAKALAALGGRLQVTPERHSY